MGWMGGKDVEVACGDLGGAGWGGEGLGEWDGMGVLGEEFVCWVKVR